MKICDKGYENLIRGLVKQTCKDYLSARKALRNNPGLESARSQIRECENFLTSDWFEAISGLNGEYLLDKLEEFKL